MAADQDMRVAVVYRSRGLAERIARQLRINRPAIAVTGIPAGRTAAARIRSEPPAVAVFEADAEDQVQERTLDSISGDPALARTAIIALTSAERPSYRLRLYALVNPDDPGNRVESAILSALEERKTPRAPAQRLETAVSEGALLRLLDFIKAATGVLVDPDKAHNLEKAVLQRTRALGLGSVWEYLNRLSSRGFAEKELDEIIPSFTVTETSFLRTEAHFRAIKSVVIPDLLRRKNRSSDRIRVWSAGCSTGEEAFSLAMTFVEEVGDLYAWDFKIIATDMNQDALDTARKGLYDHKDLKKLSTDQISKYFTESSGAFKVKDVLSGIIDFRPLNLAQGDFKSSLGETADLVFCENVIIYFDRTVLNSLAGSFFDAISPGGYLFLGYSESLYKVDHPFEDVSFENTFFYRKPLKGKAVRDRSKTPSAASAAPATPLRVPKIPPKSRPGAGRRREDSEPAPRPAAAAPGPSPRDLIAAGHFAAAASALRSELAANPESREAALLLSFSLAASGHADEASRIIAAVPRPAGLDAEIRFFEGMVLLAQGRDRDAIEAFRGAVFLDLDFYPAHFHLGELYAKAGAPRKAAVHFGNVLDILDRRAESGQVLTLDGAVAGERLAETCADSMAALSEERQT